MTSEAFTAIKARAEEAEAHNRRMDAQGGGATVWAADYAADVCALVAEVVRLRRLAHEITNRWEQAQHAVFSRLGHSPEANDVQRFEARVKEMRRRIDGAPDEASDRRSDDFVVGRDFDLRLVTAR